MCATPSKANTRIECSECGKYPKVLHRRYKGNTYCQSCYQRIFKHRACPECSQMARLPIHLPNAICRQCERNRPCIRCGVKGNKLGKFHELGPVCNKCYPYFIEPQKCSLCGKTSRKYHRESIADAVVIVCTQCRPSIDRGTCSSCHRHRKLTIDRTSGKGVCRLCRDVVTRECVRCHKSFPAGYGMVCEPCYWYGVLTQRISVTFNLFSTPIFKEYFANFGMWLYEKHGAAVAAMQLNKYSPVLRDIENKWGKLPEYHELVKYFSVAKMRRYKRFFDWLKDVGLTTADTILEKENSEQNQIAQILRSAQISAQMAQVLGSFLDVLLLQNKSGRLSLRTVRLYIRTATSIANYCMKKEHDLPMQSDIDSFLNQYPGHKASAYRFVTYLRANTLCSLWLTKSSKGTSKSRRQARLKARLIMCIDKLARGISNAKVAWDYWALRYFHGLDPKSSRKLVQSQAVMADEDGVLYTHKGKKLWIPKISISVFDKPTKPI